MPAVDVPAHLEPALAERGRQVALLGEVGRALAGDRSLDDQLSTIVAAVMRALEVQGCGVWLVDGADNGRALRARAGAGTLPSLSPEALAAVVDDSPRPGDDGAAWLGLPLVASEVVVGVLVVCGGRGASPSVSEVLGLVADQLALAVVRSASLDAGLRLAALVEESGDLIGYCSLAGQPIFCNDAGLRLLGLDNVAALREHGPDAADLVVDADRAAFVAGAATARATGRWDGEVRLRHGGSGQHEGGDEAVLVSLSLFTLKDRESGEPSALAMVGRDLRRQKADERRLRDLAENLERRVTERTHELEESNRELEAFSYSVSHDLRAPIRHINGFAEMLEKNAGTKLDTRGLHYLRTISLAAKQAATLIDDLLAFSRVARTELVMREVDLNLLVGSVQRDVLTEAYGRPMQWKIGRLPKVTGDPALLRLVLRNLLSNAVKYTRPQPAPVIEISGVDGADEVQISVTDNGVGFDMQHVDKLFGVFQRLHRAEEFEGTGIGLANVRRIVHRHGGRTFAVGRVGHGATFTFTLPVRPSA